jgi:hypothetical protein
MDYAPMRHAPVDNPDVSWVVLGRWHHDDGSTVWSVEYWDAHGNDADLDKEFATEAEAEEHAVREFGITAEDWRPGPQPLG